MFKNPFAALKKVFESGGEPEPGRADAKQNVPPEVLALRSALGGAENILKSQPKAETRLLVTLRDNSFLNAQAIREMGLNVFIPKEGGDVHVLTGLHPERFDLL